MQVLIAGLLILFVLFRPAAAPVAPVIVPDSGYNNQIVTVQLIGVKKYNAATVIQLSQTGRAAIMASRVRKNVEGAIECTFDLTGASTGQWDLVMIYNDDCNCDRRSVVFTGTFAVKEALRTPTPAPTGTATPAPTSTPTPVPTATPAPTATPLPTMTPTPLPTPSPTPLPVNTVAPPMEVNQRMRPIYFDFDKAIIRTDQLATLNRNLALLKANPHLKLVVLGCHTDERGSQEYNLALSARRAEAVKQYLIAQGIKNEAIVVFNFGKEFPAVPGHSENEWKINRRIDFQIWDVIPSREQFIESVRLD
jgi:peptidoglycan-associated lipoprotein